MRAVRSGCRYGRIATLVPTESSVVNEASHANVTNGS